MKRLKACLADSLEKGPHSPRFMREDLLQMRERLDSLLSEPKRVFLHDVLIEWKAKELSVMAQWETFPAGSNYLKARGRGKKCKKGGCRAFLFNVRLFRFFFLKKFIYLLIYFLS